MDGTLVYSAEERQRYLDAVADASVRHQLQRFTPSVHRERLYALLDAALQQQVDAYREMFACGRRFTVSVHRERYPEIAEFAKIPGVGPVGSHVFEAFIQTPERFADKQTLQGETQGEPCGATVDWPSPIGPATASRWGSAGSTTKAIPRSKC